MMRVPARFPLALALAVAGWIGPARAQGPMGPSRQVTLFGVIATPGGTAVDPKLVKVGPQLRQLLPKHGFKLLDVQSRRLAVGQTVACSLGPGYTAEAGLVSPLDDEGKVELRVAVEQGGMPLALTDVKTPPNQLFFCDKQLPDGSRLVVGVGAR